MGPGEAGDLLAAHAGLPCVVDLVAQRLQAGAVDVAAGRQRHHAVQRRGQRPRHLGRDARHPVGH
jgi:hypothetical protein